MVIGKMTPWGVTIPIVLAKRGRNWRSHLGEIPSLKPLKPPSALPVPGQEMSSVAEIGP